MLLKEVIVTLLILGRDPSVNEFSSRCRKRTHNADFPGISVPQSCLEEDFQDNTEFVYELFMENVNHRAASIDTAFLINTCPHYLEGLLQIQGKFFSHAALPTSMLFRNAHFSDPVRLNLSNHEDTWNYI